jgi:hypothetical protein
VGLRPVPAGKPVRTISSALFVVTLVGLTAAAYRHEPAWVALLFPLVLLFFAVASTSRDDAGPFEDL